MAYAKQTWNDNDAGTPDTADRRTHMEDGIYNADNAAHGHAAEHLLAAVQPLSIVDFLRKGTAAARAALALTATMEGMYWWDTNGTQALWQVQAGAFVQVARGITDAPTAHKASHVSGGGDAFAGGDLLNATARILVSQDGAAAVGARRQLNYVQGPGITALAADNAGNEAVDLTVNAHARCLAKKYYNPGSLASFGTTNNAFADWDATNGVITFTAPRTGIVIIWASFHCKVAAAGNPGYVNLRDTGGDIANTSQGAYSQTGFCRVTIPWYISGLTGGNAYTYKLGYAATASSTFTIQAGGTVAGPLTILVFGGDA